MFTIHRRREGYTWTLFSGGHLVARSGKIFTERRTAVRAIQKIKETIAVAGVQALPKGDRPVWADTL